MRWFLGTLDTEIYSRKPLWRPDAGGLAAAPWFICSIFPWSQRCFSALQSESPGGWFHSFSLMWGDLRAGPCAGMCWDPGGSMGEASCGRQITSLPPQGSCHKQSPLSAFVLQTLTTSYTCFLTSVHEHQYVNCVCVLGLTWLWKAFDWEEAFGQRQEVLVI